MRNLKFILTALLATPLLLLGGCGDDNDGTGSDGPALGKTKVDITTTIATRATDNAWENGDEIGVYMMEGNQPVSTSNIYSNKRYVTTATTATGTFAPPAGDEPMYFPTENAQVGFVAYYPYSSTVGADNMVALDVETQTDLSAIDFMVASRVTASENSPAVNLDFHHRLSKLIIEVENASEVPANAVNVTLIGLKTRASYSISNDALTDDDTSVKDIVVPMVQDGTDTDLFTGEAIILPAGTVSASINFEFPGGNSYSWDFDASQVFEKEKKYTFQFKLNKDDVVLVSPDVGGTVNDWEDGVSQGPIDLTPSGTGSQSSPFSISEAANNIGASDKWVKGYIISIADNTVTRGVAAADVRFLIGEKATETDQSKMALVKITDEDIAAWYDFTVNAAELVGTPVKVVGTFMTGTSVALIVDNVTENVGGIDPGTPGDDKMTIAEVRAMHTGTTLTIDAPNAYIEGIVVSGTNSTSKKNIIVDDGTAGIAMRFVNDAADGYPQGTKLKIMIDGVELSRYQDNSVLQLNNLPNENASIVEGGTMPQPVEITANQLLSGDFESRYVAVTGVQFASEYTNKPIGNSGSHTSTTAGEANGNDFTVFVARYSDFVTTNVPSGSGTLKGVAGFNANVIQMLPQTAADLAGLTGERFGSLELSSAVFTPGSVTVNEALSGAKITVYYDNLPSSQVINYNVSSDAAWFTAINNNAVTLTQQGSGTFDIPITGTPNAVGEVTFTVSSTNGQLSTTARLTVNDGSAPASTLLFPGSDFEDWSAFTGALTSHGLKSYATQNSTGGRNNSSALHLSGTPTANDYVFTAMLGSDITASPTKIVFYIKGTSAKSLSINVYMANGTNYNVFNLGSYSAEAVLEPTSVAASGNGTNSYTGAINTGGDWMKVTLNLSGIELSKTAGQNIFAMKVGKDAAYDLLVDDITME